MPSHTLDNAPAPTKTTSAPPALQEARSTPPTRKPTETYSSPTPVNSEPESSIFSSVTETPAAVSPVSGGKSGEGLDVSLYDLLISLYSSFPLL